jgi:hypothetical protein
LLDKNAVAQFYSDVALDHDFALSPERLTTRKGVIAAAIDVKPTTSAKRTLADS